MSPSTGATASARTPEEGLFTRMDSPVGELLLVGDERSLWRVWMESQRWAPNIDPGWRTAEQPFMEARRQLEQYFAGERRDFHLPLCMRGTPFRLQVWEALQGIPFGETRSYGEIATALGDRGASRAVGLANGRNPLAIIVPCHRVIGSNGSLVGYGGGLSRKRWLLEHERDVRFGVSKLG